MRTVSDVISLWLQRWVTVVTDAPRATVSIVALLTLLAAIYVALFTTINSDLSALVKPGPDTGWYQQDQYFKEAFPAMQQTAVVVVSGESGAAVESTAREVSQQLEASGQFDDVFAPALLPFIDEHKLYFLDNENHRLWIKAVEYYYGTMLRLSDEASLSNYLFTLADQLQADPMPAPLVSVADSMVDQAWRDSGVDVRAYPRLVDESEGTKYQLIIIKGRQNLDVGLPNAAIVRSIRDVVDHVAAAPGTRIRLTGEVVLANEEIAAGLSGVELAGTVSVLLLAIILGFGMRSLKVILMIFAMLGSGVLLTMAFATATVGSYNTLSLIFVVMFFGLGIDFAAHYVLKAMEPAAGSREAITEIGPALCLCMLTSVIAFLSFLPTAYVGLAELGIISAGGMVIAFLLTVTLLPALFEIWGLPVMPQLGRTLPATPGLPPWVVLCVAAFLALVSAGVARNAGFDYSVLAMRDVTTEGMSTLLDLQRDGMTTDYSIYVIAADDEEAATLKSKLLALPVVGTVNVPTDYVPKQQDEKSLRMASALALYNEIESVTAGDSRESIIDAIAYFEESLLTSGVSDQRLLMLLERVKSMSNDTVLMSRFDAELEKAMTNELAGLRRLLSAAPFGFEDIPPGIRARLVTPRGELLLTVQPATPLTNRDTTDAFIQAVNGVAPNIAGRSVVEWGVGEVVVNAFRFAGTTTLIVIFVLLLIYFRSVTLSFMVLTPIALASICTLAICALTSLSLNMANILVVPLIIGLGVDTGIHVVHRFVTNIDKEAYRGSTSRAVLISGLTTIGTFFALSFSPHKGAASIGILLTISISLMLVFTFLVLPALLSLRKRVT